MSADLTPGDVEAIVERAITEVDSWHWVQPEDANRHTALHVIDLLAAAGALRDCESRWVTDYLYPPDWICEDGMHQCGGYVGHPGRCTCRWQGCHSWRNR